MAVNVEKLITGVQDVYYNVQDMRRAVNFYRDILGMTVIEESKYWTALEFDGLRIGLHWTEGSAVAKVPGDEHGPHGGATLTLSVSDIHKTVEILKSHGVKLLGDVLETAWGQLAVFEDTEGNILKLMKPAAN